MQLEEGGHSQQIRQGRMEAVERNGHRIGLRSGAVAAQPQDVTNPVRSGGKQVDGEGAGQG